MKIGQTADFQSWIGKLRDRSAQAIILRRIKRYAQGNPGDAKGIGEGVFELRIH